MAHVMISYASVDRPTAQLLASRLENEGFDVWFDRDIPAGQDFGSVIEAELRKSKAVVVLWSHASVNSRWVVAEAAEAASQGKLIPAIVDDTAIPLEFRRLQAADLAGWHGERTHPGYKKLLKALRGQRPAPARSQSRRSKPAPPPKRPAGASRVVSWLFLLIGLVVMAGYAADQLLPGDNGSDSTTSTRTTDPMDDDDPIAEGFPGLFDPVNLSAPFDNSSYPFGEQNGEPSTFAEEIIAGWLRSSGCDGASRGEVVSVTGGNPAVAVIDISIPCADTGQSLFPNSGGFRMEVAMAGDENNIWTVTGLRMQVFCPRGVERGALCRE